MDVIYILVGVVLAVQFIFVLFQSCIKGNMVTRWFVLKRITEDNKWDNFIYILSNFIFTLYVIIKISRVLQI